LACEYIYSSTKPTMSSKIESKIAKTMTMQSMVFTTLLSNILSEEQIMETMSEWEKIVKKMTLTAPKSAMQHYKTDPANQQRIKDQCVAEKIKPTSRVVNERLSSEWKNMSKEEKKEWENISTEEKNAASSGLVKPASAYVWFGIKVRDSVVAENPDLSKKEITALIRGRWKDMTSDEKKQYEDIAIEEKNKYLLMVGKDLFEKENPDDDWENVQDITLWTQKAEEKTKPKKKEITPFDRYAKKMKKEDPAFNKKVLIQMWDELSDEEKKPYEIVRKSRSKVVDPTKPKRPKNAFMHFCQDKRAEVKLANPTMKAKDISKLFGQMWKEISEEERAPFTLIAKKEKEEYNSTNGITVKTKKTKTPEGFSFYKKKVLAEFKKKYPGMKGKELTSKIQSKGWDKLNEGEKNKYIDMAKKAPPRRKNNTKTKTAFDLYLESEAERLDVPITTAFRKGIRADWSAMDKNDEDKKYFKNVAKSIAEAAKALENTEKEARLDKDTDDEDEEYVHDDDIIPDFDIDFTKIVGIGHMLLRDYPEKYGNILGPVCKDHVKMRNMAGTITSSETEEMIEYKMKYVKYVHEELIRQNPKNKKFIEYIYHFGEMEQDDTDFFNVLKIVFDHTKSVRPFCNTNIKEHGCMCGMTVVDMVAKKCAKHSESTDALTLDVINKIGTSCD
jgi:hypothetical protein